MTAELLKILSDLYFKAFQDGVNKESRAFETLPEYLRRVEEVGK